MIAIVATRSTDPGAEAPAVVSPAASGRSGGKGSERVSRSSGTGLLRLPGSRLVGRLPYTSEGLRCCSSAAAMEAEMQPDMGGICIYIFKLFISKTISDFINLIIKLFN